MVFYPISHYFYPEILIFQETLIVETPNQYHWIWQALNPIYTPLKPFWYIFLSQNQQNVKFLDVSLTSPDKKLKKVNFNREKC